MFGVFPKYRLQNYGCHQRVPRADIKRLLSAIFEDLKNLSMWALSEACSLSMRDLKRR